MTGREALARDARPRTTGLLVGMGVMAAATVIAIVPGSPLPTAIFLGGSVVGALVCLGAESESILCPWCRSDLSAHVNSINNSCTIAYCPGCGRALDDPVPALDKPGDWQANGPQAKEPSPWGDEWA